MNINSVLEYARWAGVGVGIFWANYAGSSPAEQFSIITAWTVLAVAGLSGVESLFFGKSASKISGYGGGGGGYQRQSGINNLALALACVLAYALGWGTMAQAALMSTLLIFLIISAANHAYSAFREGNRNLRNLLRPVLTALLVAMVLPYMIAALS
ncbi:MAG: hypothetical protein KJ720_15225 [Proteobacteria bacterium]|nr:hypothetical protein [Pseudomonadota bacterium]MBU1451502.1 hypothetical protein [Pseudomonadota bacterium]MBU2470463.1 hypothetical protein [Pseudomonadota bacterium]MBU2519024.1 hypothetical protein [Pseudomonadota bacterium]